jgi:peptidoglycan/LPS O-acetylase OafA/YrhL
MAERDRSGRVGSLDGLRGIAALGVVVTHILLATLVTAEKLWPTWWGDEAVTIFFVLSGFVLTLPFGSPRFSWRAYYPSRFVRLYVPVWGAVAVAAILHAVTGWTVVPGATAWLNDHGESLRIGEAGQALTLIYKTGGFAYISALWTLHYEVIFSLLLPVFIAVAMVSRRVAWLAAIAALAVIASGVNGYTTELPMFFLGVLLALGREPVTATWARTPRTARALTGIILVVLITSDWWLRRAGTSTTLIPAFVAAGATGVVGLAFLHSPFEVFLERPPIKWLGRRTYSLYLVHEPIVVSLAFALGATPSVWLLLVIALPGSLAGAELFYRSVEAPSHSIARLIGRRLRQYLTIS